MILFVPKGKWKQKAISDVGAPYPPASGS